MGTFTLTQTQKGNNLFLYPNGDLSGCSEFTAVGDSPNYKCVDEVVSDGDTSYVWWNQITTGLDLYELPNHTTETGVINYVQVYARIKAHENAQHVNGVCKIICSPDSTCSQVYKSDDKNLITSYTTYSNVWTNNPVDSLPFEWSDIDTFCSGVECNSPTIPGKTNTLTIRPNGSGNNTECTPVGDTPNWKCVDEEITDEDTTYNYFSGIGTKKDLFNFQNHNLEVGAITKITLYARYRKTGAAVSAGFKWWMYTNGSLFDLGFGTYPPDAYATFSKDLTVNPATSNPWTWGEVDNIQSGYAIQNDTTETRVTQYYIVVEYVTLPINPEIRTTQCYVKVNYDEEPIECALNSPEHISTNHDRNIAMLNFWDGEREVYDLNRSGKSMVLTGNEQYAGSCDRIICIRDMTRNGSVIVISGLPLGYFNGNYRINSFGWIKISEKPEHYKWILELEDTEL